MLGSGSSPAHSVSMIYQVLPILRVTLQEKGFRSPRYFVPVLNKISGRIKHRLIAGAQVNRFVHIAFKIVQ